MNEMTISLQPLLTTECKKTWNKYQPDFLFYDKEKAKGKERLNEELFKKNNSQVRTLAAGSLRSQSGNCWLKFYTKKV